MKKNLSLILLFAVILVAFYGITNLLDSDPYAVKSLAISITVESDGDMAVNETWRVSYPEGYSVSYRDISYRKYNPDNPLYQEQSNRAGFELISVDVAGADGRYLDPSKYTVKTSGMRDERGDIIECPAGRSECESIYIRVPSGFDSEMTFRYHYVIKGAVTKYRDVAELNWIFLDQIESKIKNVQMTINLYGLSKDDIYAWGHGTSGTINIFNERVDIKVKELKKSEMLEFRLLLPSPKYDVPEINYIDRDMKQTIMDYEAKLAEETNTRILIAQIVHYGTFVILALMLAFIIIAYVKYDKEYTPMFTGQYFRELPADYSPAEMSYLYYFRKINDEDLTATVLDLIRRKYLFLDQNNQGVNDKNPDFKLILNTEKNLNDLKSHEKEVISCFINVIGDGKEVTLKQIEDFPKTSYRQALSFQEFTKSFVRKAKMEGSQHDFFEKKLGAKRGKMLTAALIPIIYTFIAFVLKTIYAIDITFTLLASIVSIILYVFYLSTIDKRSVNGNEDYAKWKAFRAFLLDFGNMKDYPIPGIVVWEHYLVYATSLKVADKVMEQLEVRLPKTLDEESLHNATYLGMSYYYPRYHFMHTFGRINTSINLARQNVTQTIVKYNSQRVGGSGGGGGFGSGGGFSGGSSFGGGGGGFRSR